jgi:SAM-dependent methyltransferase
VTDPAKPAAPVDRLKFSTIAHANHRYYGPMSPARASALVKLFDLAANDDVLDIGCGRAQLLMELLAAHPARGVGVDRNAAFIARGNATARELNLADRLTLIAKPLTEAIAEDRRFAAVLCLGSSQAIGTLAEAMAWAFRALRPGGVALFADGFWRAKPASEYLDALGGATEDEMQTHAGNADLARAAGFRVLYTMAASDDEWDEYEGLYCSSVERYVDAHPEDPDSVAMGERVGRWHEAYLRYGRATLGYGYYLLLKPRKVIDPASPPTA